MCSVIDHSLLEVNDAGRCKASLAKLVRFICRYLPAMQEIDDLPVLTALTEPRFGVDPGHAYRVAHALPGPGIFRMPNGDGVVITAHETLADLMTHPHLGAQNRATRQTGAGPVGALARVDDNSPFFINEPAHAPLAAAVYQPLSPARHDWMTEQVKGVAEAALDELLEQKHADLVRDYALAIATAVWRQILGLPKEADDLLVRCSAAVRPMLQFETSSAAIESANQTAAELLDFFRAHCRGAEHDTKGLFAQLERSIEACEVAGFPQEAAGIAAALNFDAVDSAAAATANVLYLWLTRRAPGAEAVFDASLVGNFWREAMRVEPLYRRAAARPRLKIWLPAMFEFPLAPTF